MCDQQIINKEENIVPLYRVFNKQVWKYLSNHMSGRKWLLQREINTLKDKMSFFFFSHTCFFTVCWLLLFYHECLWLNSIESTGEMTRTHDCAVRIILVGLWFPVFWYLSCISQWPVIKSFWVHFFITCPQPRPSDHAWSLPIHPPYHSIHWILVLTDPFFPLLLFYTFEDLLFARNWNFLSLFIYR